MEYNSKIEGKRQKKTSKKGQETNDRGQKTIIEYKRQWARDREKKARSLIKIEDNWLGDI